MRTNDAADRLQLDFRDRLLESFMKEWQLRKQQLDRGEITKAEYMEWKLNWPLTADDCGRFEPGKPWRKMDT